LEIELLKKLELNGVVIPEKSRASKNIPKQLTLGQKIFVEETKEKFGVGSGVVLAASLVLNIFMYCLFCNNVIVK
jgi:hypothetical protein